jgi:hypothetical protein
VSPAKVSYQQLSGNYAFGQKRVPGVAAASGLSMVDPARLMNLLSVADTGCIPDVDALDRTGCLQ